MSGSVIQRVAVRSAGFSLLEIILVMAFTGLLLAGAATWARKIMDERLRQGVAQALSAEVQGVLQFVNSDLITVSENNGRPKRLVNPLYQMPGQPVSDLPADGGRTGIENNPLWQAHSGNNRAELNAAGAAVSPYIARVYAGSATAGIRSHSLKWSPSYWLSQGGGQQREAARRYFTDSRCTAARPQVTFNQPFISCEESPLLVNSELAIARVDLVNDSGTVSRFPPPPGNIMAGTDRVDVYVSFRPADGNMARIDQFTAPLLRAFDSRKVSLDRDSIHLVRRLRGSGNNRWALLDKVTGQPAVISTPPDRLARITDLPQMLERRMLPAVAGQEYGLRLSFGSSGGYLRSDGLNSAARLCWSSAAGRAGPCLESPSPSLLVLRRRDNPGEPASAQVRQVISRGQYRDAGGTLRSELYTAPQVQYLTFGRSSIRPLYREPGGRLCDAAGCPARQVPRPSDVTSLTNGAIMLPLQSCPQALGDDSRPVTLHPRLSASLSSVVAGLRQIAGSAGGINHDPPADVFGRQDDMLGALNSSDITINRLGGVVLHITRDADSWYIGGMVAAEDTRAAGRNWQYYNPRWVSLLVTAWCSSVPQP